MELFNSLSSHPKWSSFKNISDSDYLKFQTEVAKVRRNRQVTAEKVEKLRQRLETIDHTKKSRHCSLFSCVFDTNIVKNCVSESGYNVKTNSINPLDFTAPYGPAYYNAYSGSPLVTFCDHNPCFPAQSHVYSAIKVFNMDGVLSQSPIIDDDNLPWYSNRGHHKMGEESQKELLDSEYGIHGLDADEYEEFIDNLLSGSHKYPRTNVLDEDEEETYLSYSSLIGENSIAARINEMNDFKPYSNNEECVNAIIKACMDQIVEYDFELIWNPLLDGEIDITEISNNQSGPCTTDNRYQPLDLFGMWKTQLATYKLLPAVFTKVPGTDLNWYRKMHDAISSNSFSSDFKTDCELYPTFLNNKIDTQRKSVVKVWCNFYKGKNWFHIKFDNNGKCFSFPETEVVHVVDSLLDLALLHGEDLRVIDRELKFMGEDYNYQSGAGFQPSRSDFLLEDKNTFQFNSHIRKAMLKTCLIKNYDRPNFHFSYVENHIVITRYSTTFSIPCENVMFIFCRLITLCINKFKMGYPIDDGHNLYWYINERCKSVNENNWDFIFENKIPLESCTNFEENHCFSFNHTYYYLDL